MSRQVCSYRFGPYELRTSTHELFKHGVKLKLRPQPAQVLLVLLERAGEGVNREALRERVWASNTFVDFERGLNTEIKELRAVLNDSPAAPKYIETLPKFGYRMIAPVEVELEAPDGVGAALVEVEKGATPRQEQLPVAADKNVVSRRRWLWVAGVAAMLLLVLTGYLAYTRIRPGPEAGKSRVMIAVLPFQNLTGDAGQEYFSDGLTEEMIAQLSLVDPEQVGVIDRTSAMHFKHSQENLEQIGRELGVQYVLEGSVRREANVVRVSAQLIRVKDQTHLWSRQYDRESGSLLMLQGEIALAISDEIESMLGHPKIRTPLTRANLTTQQAEAHDLYLRGRYNWNKRTKEGYRMAAEYFQQAIAKDPNYARAYAGLADTFALMCTWHLVAPREFMPKARAAALKALQIDETVAEAHTSLALVAESYDYDWKTAEKQFQRAIELNPSYATAHQWYAEYLSWQGRSVEALAESELARQLDPLSVIIATDHGAILFNARQYDKAITQLRTVLEMDASFSRARGILVSAYVQEGKFADALDVLEQEVGSKDLPWNLADKAYVYGRSGRQASAQQALLKLKAIMRDTSEDATLPLLLAHIGMDEKDEAMDLLEKSYDARSSVVLELKVSPVYDPLRDDPRFQDLLRRAGLAN